METETYFYKILKTVLKDKYKIKTNIFEGCYEIDYQLINKQGDRFTIELMGMSHYYNLMLKFYTN